MASILQGDQNLPVPTVSNWLEAPEQALSTPGTSQKYQTWFYIPLPASLTNINSAYLSTGLTKGTVSELYQELPETVPKRPIRGSKSGVQALSFKVSPGMTHLETRNPAKFPIKSKPRTAGKRKWKQRRGREATILSHPKHD